MLFFQELFAPVLIGLPSFSLGKSGFFLLYSLFGSSTGKLDDPSVTHHSFVEIFKKFIAALRAVSDLYKARSLFNRPGAD